jgi:hypothetical protein
MARNKMSDLRDHMFAALERLNDDELTSDELQKELSRAKSIASIGSVLVNSAKVEIDYMKAMGIEESTSELFKSVPPQKQLGNE